jgi:ABC-type multidrug transport system fused ATPase/permease subunit
MRPFDPRLLTQVPATRKPVVALGAIGAGQGLATIALAFAVTNLVVAVVEGSHPSEVLTPGIWLVGLFTVRALLAVANELVGSWAGLRVSTVLRERLMATWLVRDADSRPEAGRAQALATQGMTSIEPYVARYLPALVSGAFLPLLAIGTLASTGQARLSLRSPSRCSLSSRRSSGIRPRRPLSGSGEPCRRCPVTSWTSCEACRPSRRTGGPRPRWRRSPK